MEVPVVPTEGLATTPGVSRTETNVTEAPRVAWWLVVWIAGTLAVVAWGLIGWASTWWMGCNAQRITNPTWVEAAREAAERLGTCRGVTLLRGGPAAMPLTWGVLRPVLLLPQEADEWPCERRRAVLLHELAHVRRRDVLTHWLGLTACAAYWFNPLAWWAASRLRTEREQACDDLVLEAGERPTDYAAQLLGVARSLRSARALAPAAMAMARPSNLETRLTAILDTARNRRGPARWLVAASLAAVLAASAVLAAVRLVANEPPRPVLSGQVVGPNGKPLEGAEVVVLASRLWWRNTASAKTAPQSLGRGRCNDRGRFRVELTRDGMPEPGEGRVVLVATAPDHGFVATDLTELNATIKEPIRLPAEQPVEVRLVDLEGSPIAGAEVRPEAIHPDGNGTGLSFDILSQETGPVLFPKLTTNQDGRFTMRGCGADHSAYFEIRAPGFGKHLARFFIKAGGSATALSLGRAHVVEGRVTLGNNGPPASGADRVADDVRKGRLWNDSGARRSHDRSRRTLPDRGGAGCFDRFEGLPAQRGGRSLPVARRCRRAGRFCHIPCRFLRCRRECSSVAA